MPVHFEIPVFLVLRASKRRSLPHS